MAEERRQTADCIRRLVDWAVGIEATRIPPEVLSRGGRIVADDLCAIIAARDEPEVARFHQHTLSRPAPAQATVFRGGRPRTDRLSAAVANAVAADWLELDEGYRKTPCHAGLYVVPALLAEAEAGDQTVRDMLRAVVLGYEVVTRIARAWSAPDLAMHAHARHAAIGAAAAAALLRRLDAEQALAAITAASTLICAGPRDHAVQGALVRNVWPAVGAWSGLMSVEWSACGIGGIAESPYDVFTTLLGGTPHPERLTADLGESWAVLDGYMKIHACCQQTHSAVEATQALRGELLAQAALSAVARVKVETHALAMPLKNYRPATTLAAKFSLPHVVAATLATGNAGVEAFSRPALRDPEIARLREKVELQPFEPRMSPPNDRPARVTAVLDDDRAITRECLSAEGGPDRPFPAAVLWNKISALAEPVYPAFAAVFAAVIALDATRLAQPWPETVAELCARRARPAARAGAGEPPAARKVN